MANSKLSNGWNEKLPEKHGESVDANHVVSVAVGEEELVSCDHPALALNTVKPE